MYTLHVYVSQEMVHVHAKFPCYFQGITTQFSNRSYGSNKQSKSYLLAFQGKQHPDHCFQKFQQYPHHFLLHLFLKVILQEANLLQGQLCLELVMRMFAMDQLESLTKLYKHHK